MLRVIAATALAAALAGCTVHEPCADGTVLVALTLADGAAQADELVVDVALDGGAPRETSLAHAPGSAAGNVVVQFPSGYPHGHTVTVGVTARAAGAELGRGSVAVALSAGCEAVALTIAQYGADDLGADLADAGADLAPPADLARCVPTTESCFNGVDDDCDGLIDCDDPDCTTVAVCVPPVTAPYVVGSTLDDPKSLCPTSYSKLSVINSGLTDPGCSMGGCSCSMVCQAQVYNFFGGGCPSTDNEQSLSVVYNTMCQSWTNWNNTVDVHELATPLSCTASGTTTAGTPTWASSKEFCSTAAHGGGCSNGGWCVPVTPGGKCELADGAHTCDSGYDAVSGPWYTGIDDTRSCSCTCGAPTGNCGTTVTLYTDSSCNGGATPFTATGSNNINCSVGGGPFLSGKINVSPTTNACGAAGYYEGGAATGTGLQTLCCAP